MYTITIIVRVVQPYKPDTGTSVGEKRNPSRTAWL